MKKIYILVIFSLLLFAGENSFSQTFTFVNHDTIVCGSTSSDIECYFGDLIINNTSSPLALDVVRVQNVTTTGWTSAFCTGSNCYLPTKDSVRITLPADSSTGIIIHFYTSSSSGNDSVLFKVKDPHTPLTAIYQRYYGSSLCTGVNELFVNSANVKVYPSPLISGNDFNMNITNVQNGNKEISLLVYSIYGSVVSKINNLKEGNNILNLNLSDGIYSYSLFSGNASIYSGKIVVAKSAY